MTTPILTTRQLLFSALFGVMVFCTPTSANQVHGVIQIVKGDVQILSIRDGKTARAKVGQKVYPKDTVITGKDSRIKIVMIDKNVINVSPESKLEIANYEFDPGQNRKDVLLNVIYGKVRSKVEQRYDGAKNKFEVKTPTAVAGVRGTDFLAGYQPSTQLSQVVTFEGEVKFGLPGPDGSIANAVSVRPGQFTEMAGSNPPPAPQPMPQSQLANLDLESKADSPKGDTRQPTNDTPANQNSEGKKENGGKDSPVNGSDGQKEHRGQPNGQSGDQGGDGKRAPSMDGESPRGSNEGSSGTSGGTSAPSVKSPLGSLSMGSRGDQAKGPVGIDGTSANSGAIGGPASPQGPRGPAAFDGPAGTMPSGPNPGTMLRPEDMATSPSGVLPEFNSMMPPPPPPNYLPPQPITCEFCSRLIERGNTLLRLNITNQ